MFNTNQNNLDLVGANKLKEILKDELNRTNDGILNLEIKVDKNHKELKKEISEKFDEVLESNDKIASKLDKIIAESASHSISYKQHEEVIDDHENRIKKLELQPAM